MQNSAIAFDTYFIWHFIKCSMLFFLELLIVKNEVPGNSGESHRGKNLGQFRVFMTD